MQDFTTTYDLYKAPIFRYCVAKCRDREVGQDLMQETFLRYWLYLQTEQNVIHARAFLYRIAFNLFIDHTRRKKESSLDELVEKGFEPPVDPWQQTYNAMEAEKLFTAIEKMKSPYRNVLHLRFVKGLAPAQIAAKTGCSANAVSVGIFRGLKDLRVQTIKLAD